MSEAEIHNRPEAPRGYVLTLAAATAAASVGGFALWASQNIKIGQPLWWQGGSLAAALIAAKLTLAATKQRGQMRPQRSLLDSFNAKLDAAAAALSRMPESEGRRSDRNGASAKAAADRIRTRAANESRIQQSRNQPNLDRAGNRRGARDGRRRSRRPLRRAEQSRRRHDACAELPAQPRRRSRAHAQSPRPAASTHGSRSQLGGEVRGDRRCWLTSCRSGIYDAAKPCGQRQSRGLRSNVKRTLINCRR